MNRRTLNAEQRSLFEEVERYALGRVTKEIESIALRFSVPLQYLTVRMGESLNPKEQPELLDRMPSLPSHTPSAPVGVRQMEVAGSTQPHVSRGFKEVACPICKQPQKNWIMHMKFSHFNLKISQKFNKSQRLTIERLRKKINKSVIITERKAA